MRQKSIAFHTLGCKLNYSETSTISRMMEAAGYTKKSFEEEADVYVINTCSVTENADKECKQLVRRIQRKTPEAMVVITGCYAQLKPTEIAEIPGVDLVLGAAEKFNIITHINNFTKGDSTKICSCEIEDVKDFTSTYSEGDRTRTFLKVQDGCNYNCSFCTIPMARGESRSDTIENVLENIKAIGEAGSKEIVLTGINLGDFESNQQNFTSLVNAIEAANTLVNRFRISSIEPNLLTDEIITTVANSKKWMPHFHIPLQSGSNRILGLMRRRYKREVYTARVQRIKEIMPHCCIGVDVIVGFPGESDEDFQETFQFLHDLDVSYLHVFTYSERADTLAASMPNAVPINIRNERNKILRNLSYKKMEYFLQQHINTNRPVLWEKFNKNGKMEGYTDNYLRAEMMYNDSLAGEIADYAIQ
ncbi:MAG: tRNA (N(6)-L-threonylcarbamoyladenosine(37)-C(2))-methylthiotransferase MtaB [Chitinophagaceae bacterium]|nr:tRNA (N(6)-L-threonylcarbamoyladenosine(37)-C(2))-methylthiotransferase MtaB [Chitinophagaceae bacterium]